MNLSTRPPRDNSLASLRLPLLVSSATELSAKSAVALEARPPSDPRQSEGYFGHPARAPEARHLGARVDAHPTAR
eukprot:3798042-Pyramimonas_sp.AAC.1